MIISINNSAILNSKITKSDVIKESYDKLVLDKTPINVINFMNTFRSCDKQTMLENISYLVQVNTSVSRDLIKMLINTSNLTESQMNLFVDKVSVWESLNYPEESLEYLKECLNTEYDKLHNIKCIKESFEFDLLCSRIKDDIVEESSEPVLETGYLYDELYVIMYNINENPEVIEDFEKIVRDIKLNNTTKYVTSFPMILQASTDIVMNTKVKVMGDVLDLLTSIPTVVADKLILLKINKTQIKSFIKIYEKQIANVFIELKKGDATKYNILSAYNKKLIAAKNRLDEYYNMNSVNENIADMQPIVGAEDIEVVKQTRYDLEDALTDFIFDEEEDDDKLMDSFLRIIDLAESYNVLTEDGLSGKPSKVGKTAQKVAKVNQKIGSKVQQSAADARRTSTAINRSFQPIVNTINKTINDLKEKDKRSREEEIINGQYQFKISRLIKMTIGVLGGAAAGKAVTKAAVKGGVKLVLKGGFKYLTGPMFVLLGLLVAVAIDKKIERKHRQRILIDLENELKMVDEKIQDASSDGDREAKYELMRIKMKLEKDIERIKFNLK